MGTSRANSGESNMTVKQAKVGMKTLYRGRVAKIKTIRTIKNHVEVILSNGLTTRVQYLKAI